MKVNGFLNIQDQMLCYIIIFDLCYGYFMIVVIFIV